MIDLLGPDHDLDVLKDALQQLDESELFAFDDLLGAFAGRLDTPAHADQPVRDVDHPADAPIIPMSDDAFEWVRFAVVAHGRSAWERIVSEPSRLAGTWPMDLGEDLAHAAASAYEAATGNPWPVVSHLGSQAAGSEVTELPPLPRWRWLHIIDNGHGAGGMAAPMGYAEHLTFLEDYLNEDQRWWQWWHGARGEESTLLYYVDFTDRADVRPRTSIRVSRDFANRDEVVVSATFPVPPEFDSVAAGLDGPTLARRHLDHLLDRVCRRFTLTAPPDLEPTDALERLRGPWTAQREQAAMAEHAALDAYNRHRSSEHIWRGRAPDAAVDALVEEVIRGGRLVRLPAMIARLRADYGIAVSPDDAERLAEAGYSPQEIATILGASKGGSG